MNIETDLMHLMVMHMEGRELAKSKPEITEVLAELDKVIDKKILKLGFIDIAEVRLRLQMPVQRIAKARKAADEHLIELARLQL